MSILRAYAQIGDNLLRNSLTSSLVANMFQGQQLFVADKKGLKVRSTRPDQTLTSPLQITCCRFATVWKRPRYRAQGQLLIVCAMGLCLIAMFSFIFKRMRLLLFQNVLLPRDFFLYKAEKYMRGLIIAKPVFICCIRETAVSWLSWVSTKQKIC